jgi:hypothetical protein
MKVYEKNLTPFKTKLIAGKSNDYRDDDEKNIKNRILNNKKPC